MLAEALAYVPANHYLTNVVLSAALVRLGKRIEFVPITFAKRTTGVNSINIRSIVRIGVRALRDFREIDKALPR